MPANTKTGHYRIHMQVRIPVAVVDPGAVITIEPLCPAKLMGHAVAAHSIDARRHGRPYRFLYCACIVGPRP